MAGRWTEIPISGKLFQNVQEAALRKGSAAIENAFINEMGGHTRFPGLELFATLTGNLDTFLHEWKQDLIAVSSSRMWRIEPDGTKEDVTGAPIGGPGRVMFDRTDNELVAAAGAEIVRFNGATTEVLSPDAPLSTHIGYIDRYLLALEVNSGRFEHCNVGDFRTWDPLDVFAASGKPDDLNALMVTPYREVLCTGLESVEQFEPFPQQASGQVPFYRRWAVGEGLLAPYTLCFEDQGAWGVNKRREFVRFSGQVSEPRSEDVANVLEGVDDWTGAWAMPLQTMGQKFIVLKIPHATNAYETEGITLLYDVRSKKWTNLYGWTASSATPSVWPGTSYYRMWGRHFVGGPGCVYELKSTVHNLNGAPQRMLGRTAHLDAWGRCFVDNLEVRVKRGFVAQGTTAPRFALRACLDAKRWTRWLWKDLGTSGDKHQTLYYGPLGEANTWQFEWMCTADCELELVHMKAQITPAEPMG